jgi:hypothetical protein
MEKYSQGEILNERSIINQLGVAKAMAEQWG